MLIKTSAHTFFTATGIAVVGFVSSVITACVLGPEGRGLFSAALLISTLAYMGTIERYGYYTVVFMTSKLIGSVQDAISTTLFASFADKNMKSLATRSERLSV